MRANHLLERADSYKYSQGTGYSENDSGTYFGKGKQKRY